MRFDQGQQPLHAANAVHDRQLGRGDAECGRSVRKTKVAGQRQMATAAEAIAGNGGDYRLAQTCNRIRTGIDGDFVIGALQLIDPDLAEFRDVGTDAETIASPRQHHGAHVRLASEIREYRGEFTPHPQRHCVPDGRPI